MKIEKTYEYDFNSQCVLRPTNQMTVIYARGVIEKWKQPIYVDFDKPVTKKILFDIVKKFCDIDFQVVALVSVCHPSNRGLWRSCGVDINNLNEPYFTTPFSDQKIFIFPDAPHVLKLIRNWFLDTGYLWDGIKITHFPIEELTQARGDLFSLFTCFIHININVIISPRVCLAGFFFIYIPVTFCGYITVIFLVYIAVIIIQSRSKNVSLPNYLNIIQNIQKNINNKVISCQMKNPFFMLNI